MVGGERGGETRKEVRKCHRTIRHALLSWHCSVSHSVLHPNPRVPAVGRTEVGAWLVKSEDSSEPRRPPWVAERGRKKTKKAFRPGSPHQRGRAGDPGRKTGQLSCNYPSPGISYLPGVPGLSLLFSFMVICIFLHASCHLHGVSFYVKFTVYLFLLICVQGEVNHQQSPPCGTAFLLSEYHCPLDPILIFKFIFWAVLTNVRIILWLILSQRSSKVQREISLF